MASDPEKTPVEPVDEMTAVKASPTTTTYSDLSEDEKRKIIRRVDRRLVTILGLMYCISLMDRTNLPIASIAGMRKELNLDIDNRYNIISLAFFPTYVIFQPPSTFLVRLVGPKLHLALITLLWGCVMIGMGFVADWDDLAGLRVILGIFEAGFFPSCVYLLSTWYTRYEVGKRNAVFYLLGSMASAFAGIMAFGIMQMNGLAGLSGWRWIFVMEGIITCIIAALGYWLLVDFPDSKRKTWSFIPDHHREWIIARVHADRGDTKVLPFHIGSYLRGGTDWKIWVYAMIFFDTTTITYALAYFMPIILNGALKFDVGTSQCLIAPPYVLAAIVMYGTSWVGDKYRIRGPIIVFNNLLCIIGLPLIGWVESPVVRYLGIFLTTAGANSNIPAVMSYQANNIRGQWKRAFCSATLVGFGGIGGIAGSLVFRNEDYPNYKPGLWACLACCLLTIILVGILSITYKAENDKADRGEKELETSEDDFTPGFRYTY